MKKKLIAWLLVICMAISLLPAAALADTAATSGKCGDNVTWTLSDDGTLTISGKGAMWDFGDSRTVPWPSWDYYYKIKNVVVEEGVTRIGSRSFFAFGIESLTVPSSVKSIGSDAFRRCNKLSRIDMKPGVTTIERYAFYLCDSITELPIPNTVTSLGKYVFGGCQGIINLTIPESIQTIGDNAFDSCYEMETVSFGKTVKTIDKMAFNVTHIKDVYFSGTEAEYNAIVTAGTFPEATVHYNHTHNYTSVETVAPTCTEKGYDKYVCANGEFKRENYVKAKGHTEVVVPGYPATYEKEGLSDGKICSECGATLVKQSVIPVRVDYISDVYIKDLTLPQIGQKLDYDITLSTSPNANMIADGDKAPVYEWYAYNDYTGEYEPITAPNYICNSRSYRLYITMYPAEHCGFDKSTNYWLNGDLLGQTAGDIETELLDGNAVRIQLNFGLGYDKAHTISAISYTNMPYRCAVGERVDAFTPAKLKDDGKTGTYFWYLTKLDKNDEIVGMYIAKNQEATALKILTEYTSKDIAEMRQAFGATFESGYSYALYNIQVIDPSYQYASTVRANITFRNGESGYMDFNGQSSEEIISMSLIPILLYTIEKAPTLKITTSAGHPKLSWNAVPGASKYWIYRSTDGKNFKYYDSTTKTSYTNNSTTIGTTYYYKVKAVTVTDGENITTDYSAIKSIKCRPAAPTVTISRSGGKAKLSWKAVSGATKYWVYRSTDGKKYTRVISTTKLSYTDSKSKSGTKYYYKVMAVAVVNETNVGSACSAVKSIMTTLAKPTVKITTVSGKPKLSWSKVTGADKYYVYRSTNGKDYTLLIKTTKTSVTNTGAKKGTKYYYKVKAICSANTKANSAYSAVVSIKATK